MVSTAPIFSAPLMGGDAGVQQTVSLIRSMVDDAWKDSSVNNAAVNIIRSAGVQPYDALGQIQAIYNWVHSNIYFVNDPHTKEALRPAASMLQPSNRYGDCDDINAILLPSLLGTLGFETRIVTIAADPSADAFTHVYCEVLAGGDWIPLDAASPTGQFGVAPTPRGPRAPRWWSLTDDNWGDFQSMGRRPRLSGTGMGAVSVVPALLNEISSGVSNITSAALNEPVPQLSVVTPAIGPGGYTTLSSQAYVAPVATAGLSTSAILILLGLGLLAAGAL